MLYAVSDKVSNTAYVDYLKKIGMAGAKWWWQNILVFLWNTLSNII